MEERKRQVLTNSKTNNKISVYADYVVLEKGVAIFKNRKDIGADSICGMFSLKKYYVIFEDN